VTDAVAMAFVTGLLGGFGHCIGMCGPLVGSFALATGALGPRHSLAGQLAYHGGRITTYALLGAVMGLTGSFVNVAGRLAGLQDVVAVLAGVLMILLGLGAAGVSGALKKLEARASARVVRIVRGLLSGGGPGRLYPTGLALGLLPCGLSWTMFLGAAATGSVPEALPRWRSGRHCAGAPPRPVRPALVGPLQAFSTAPGSSSRPRRRSSPAGSTFDRRSEGRARPDRCRSSCSSSRAGGAASRGRTCSAAAAARRVRARARRLGAYYARAAGTDRVLR
jgi:hypothetical protein